MQLRQEEQVVQAVQRPVGLQVARPVTGSTQQVAACVDAGLMRKKAAVPRAQRVSKIGSVAFFMMGLSLMPNAWCEVKYIFYPMPLSILMTEK